MAEKNESNVIEEALDRENDEKKSKKVKKLGSKKKTAKKIITLIIVLLLAGVSAFGVWRLFFKAEEKIAMTGTTTWGALDRSIEGSGTTVPAESLSVSVASNADIEEVYVSVGDYVEKGQLLYKQDDSSIDEQISDLEDQIEDYYDEINDYESSITSQRTTVSDAYSKLEDYRDSLSEYNEAIGDAVITADFSGKITGISIEEGKNVNSGAILATLTDESVMNFSQYYSYSYENKVKVGMEAQVTVDGLLHTLTGKVSSVSRVEWVSDEGMRCFEVTVEVENPGSLTDKNTATAVLVSLDGSKLYPVKEGKLNYKNTVTVTAPTSGEILDVAVVNYDTVISGQKLFEIDTDSYEAQIENTQKQIENTENQIENAYKQIENYQKKIETANEKISDAYDSISELEESRSDYLVASEIAGKVMYVNIEAGERPGMMVNSAVTIYNLETMNISVNFDELDIDYVTEGTPVVITRSGAESSKRYNGTVTYISPEATSSGGVATFAATIEIDSMGELSAGVSVSYAISLGDSEEGVLAPISALKSHEDNYYLYVKSDKRPDNAVDLEEPEIEVPQGFWAVPVEVGNSNSMYVRIISGVDKDIEVFTRYRQTAPGNSSTTSKNGEEEPSFEDFFGSGEMPGFDGNMPNMSGNMPSFNGQQGGTRPDMSGNAGGNRGGR